MRPKVLVLDEPAAGLDPKGRAEILGGLRAYCDRTGISIIIVSHSMEDIARYCDDIIVMNKGSVVLHGSADVVFSDTARLCEYGLNVPDVTRICNMLKERGLPIEGTILTVEEACRRIKACFDEKRGSVNV